MTFRRIIINGVAYLLIGGILVMESHALHNDKVEHIQEPNYRTPPVMMVAGITDSTASAFI